MMKFKIKLDKAGPGDVNRKCQGSGSRWSKDPVVRGAAGQPAHGQGRAVCGWGAGLQPEEAEVKPRVG